MFKRSLCLISLIALSCQTVFARVDQALVGEWQTVSSTGTTNLIIREDGTATLSTQGIAGTVTQHGTADIRKNRLLLSVNGNRIEARFTMVDSNQFVATDAGNSVEWKRKPGSLSDSLSLGSSSSNQTGSRTSTPPNVEPLPPARSPSNRFGGLSDAIIAQSGLSKPRRPIFARRPEPVSLEPQTESERKDYADAQRFGLTYVSQKAGSWKAYSDFQVQLQDMRRQERDTPDIHLHKPYSTIDEEEQANARRFGLVYVPKDSPNQGQRTEFLRAMDVRLSEERQRRHDAEWASAEAKLAPQYFREANDQSQPSRARAHLYNLTAGICEKVPNALPGESASSLYLKAAKAWGNEISQESVPYFEKARTIDPDDPFWPACLAQYTWETNVDASERYLRLALAAKRQVPQTRQWCTEKLSQVPNQRRILAARANAQIRSMSRMQSTNNSGRDPVDVFLQNSDRAWRVQNGFAP